ncbi:hypothetical protein [Kitasatospora sp. NPDC005856]|uniref:hypothetical protein n=1 Tax=Kitasatospora sp. NPDC005856 TaxID=3154566 RepID=UPI0033C58496
MDESQSDGEITRNAPEGSPVRRAGRSLRDGFRRSGFRQPRPLRTGREWAGWLLAAAGAVLCVLGWYGTSGERFVEQQVPYLASSTIPGAALIVSGTILVVLRPPPSPPERADLTDRRVERLYDLLVEPDAGPAPPDPAHRPGQASRADIADSADHVDDAGGAGDTDDAGGAGDTDDADDADDAGWLAVPEGTRYHRPHCPLVTGKERAAPVDANAVRARGLTPCPLCSPSAAGPGPTRPGESTPPSG